MDKQIVSKLLQSDSDDKEPPQPSVSAVVSVPPCTRHDAGTQDIATSSESDGDESMDSQSADDSLYLPTPERMVRKNIKNVAIVPLKVCFMDLSQLDKFMKQLNEVRVCATPGCEGKLTPVHVKSAGLGGAVSIAYNCTGCVSQTAIFETSAKYELNDTTEVSIAVQVAFIIAGSTHTTYHKTLKHALGIDAVPWQTFQSTIRRMYPIVKTMVDRMCEDAKDDMQRMDQDELGSWGRAVTSADGTWMTRGFHSANATFSIRNYYNGALLYRKHLCQRGRDDVVKENLYEGTSKGAEGYAARLTFKKAKEEGMNIAVQWQDADSSSSKAVTDHFPNAEIMICGGHAGRAHKKQLEKLSKMKSFTEDLIRKHKADFPSVVDVVCHCSRHKPGCGCMSDKFIEKARNNFSLILSRSETANEFSSKMKALARHARDEHEWDEGKCDFHQIRVCSCKQCNGEDLKCEGKEYHTRCALTCPFHSLAYEIECHERAEMSKQLVHPVLKRGHSNWLEASHGVFIRFRPKHINLDRLHYMVATELALLQSNMTYMYEKRGPQYHWVVELFEQLRLPIFDGIRAALEAFNQKRKKDLDRKKTEGYKLRRVHLKKERATDAQCRKEWSKKHGHDTYGDDVSDKEGAEVKGPRARRKTKVSKCRACESTTHQRSTHRDCPFNKKVWRADASSRLEDDQASENSDIIALSEDSLTDEEGFCSEEHVASSDSDWCFEDDIIRCDKCTCGAISRAHKKDCPLNSLNRCTLFAKSDSRACKGVGSDVEKNSAQPAQLGKRERLPREKPPTAKKRKPKCSSFQVGDYVSVHSTSLKKYHLPCRVVQVFGKVCRLYCGKGLLKKGYVIGELMPLSSTWTVSVENWRTAAEVSTGEAISDPSNIEVCKCCLVNNVVDLTSNSDAVSADASTTSSSWLRNTLYTLTSTNREEVLSPSGWLSDSVIAAAQLLILQEFPHMCGLQSPVLQQTLAFKVHGGEFVQIIHVGGNHWCTVSNVGCDDGVVDVYDSLCPSVSNVTLRVISSLVYSSAPKLVVRMRDVGKQSNGSDCGVLAIAFAYDVCSHSDPCRVKYDHKLIRQHLADCLEKCCLSRFPVVRGRRSSGVRYSQSVDLHCSCRLPEEKGDRMAECDTCKTWYHQHCMDIPDYIFDDESEVPWVCKSCDRL